MHRTNILLLLLPLLLCQCAVNPPEPGLADGRLRACPDSPNCLNSETVSGRAMVEPLTYQGSAEQAWEMLQQVVAESGGKITATKPDYLKTVYTTRFLRFKDDVEFRLDRQKKVIHLRSASRVGYSDLGANRRRVEKIRKMFNQLQSAGEQS